MFPGTTREKKREKKGNKKQDRDESVWKIDKKKKKLNQFRTIRQSGVDARRPQEGCLSIPTEDVGRLVRHSSQVRTLGDNA